MEASVVFKKTTNLLHKKIASSKEISIFEEWCKKEKWNVGIYDFEIYYKLDKNGHMLFWDQNQLVGIISIIKHSNDYFTLGPYIVSPEYRNKGYGSFIIQAALSYPRNINCLANIGLCAVSDQVKRYEKIGFKTTHLNHRWIFDDHTIPNKQFSDYSCTPIIMNHLNQLVTYDTEISPTNRTRLFIEMINHPDINGFLIQKHGKVQAYGFIRPCLDGYRVGPLIANSEEHALAIVLQLIRDKNNKNVIFDIPSTNKHISTICKKLNLYRDPECDTHAMFTKDLNTPLLTNTQKSFSVFSLEIG